MFLKATESSTLMEQLFFCFDAKCSLTTCSLDDHRFHCSMLRPGTIKVGKEGITFFPASIWLIFHYLRIFSNPSYSVFVIYNKDLLVHRSHVFPPYFRFPFMAERDIQIGDTWTHPDFRGHGLATFALFEIVRRYSSSNLCIWYVVEETNLSSVKVATKVGFSLIGKGTRTKKFGLSLFGQYIVDPY